MSSLFVQQPSFSGSTPNLSSLSAAEEAGHVQRARHFVQNEVIPSSSHFDSTGEFPWPWVRRAHALGLMNTGMPAEHGGIGLPLAAKVGIFETIAYGDIGLGTTLMVSELSQQPLLYAGTLEQKQKFLLPMLAQPLLASFAVTEPEAGSDVSNVSTSAEPNEDGTFYVLNGAKKWITNCGVAQWWANVFLLLHSIF
ncbi:hypothetical protein niasHS_009842 [Heterodera schachtii]|uniref:Acyl-CoA dehydrogenase n=1 Tax=Heterodera schachtii TaxID=97005 RepID=A0ABD2JAJ1_HETSC